MSKGPGWWRGENCNDLPMTSQEILILETYEAEQERGLLHNDTWHKRMAQLVALREKAERGGA